MTKRIWAPWRTKYIKKILKENKVCVFCKILKEKKDVKNYIVLRTKYCFSVLNIYPYNNGHLLILPKRHVDDLSKLEKNEREDLLNLLDLSKDLVDQAIKPHGYNIGINVGRVAGAGFPGHLHIHLVPRWKGDANFMPVVSDTRVISESLAALHKKLTYVYKRKF